MSYRLLPTDETPRRAKRHGAHFSAARQLRAPSPDEAPQRARALTRRYEATWLTDSGEVQSSTRIAPATALFEEAFSAMARGTLITTDAGPVAVEDLVPGMRAITGEGRAETITWIGSLTLYPDPQGRGIAESMLTRITAEAFGASRPMPDLVLGPRARLLLRDARCRAISGSDTVYVPARAFIDGVSVIELRTVTPVVAYHVVLKQHASLRVMGMEVESYHPGTGIEAMVEPRLLALFAACFPHIQQLSDFGPEAHPRMTRFELEHLLE
ncbi:Hint domain-containing protein [Phaeovulum sp.]|uniref:Hint domain-containing protein n=1 Tax=Phaeovulum sp. TaxID=2934796 RepID=UPI0035665A1B